MHLMFELFSDIFARRDLTTSCLNSTPQRVSANCVSIEHSQCLKAEGSQIAQRGESF